MSKWFESEPITEVRLQPMIGCQLIKPCLDRQRPNHSHPGRQRPKHCRHPGRQRFNQGTQGNKGPTVGTQPFCTWLPPFILAAASHEEQSSLCRFRFFPLPDLQLLFTPKNSKVSPLKFAVSRGKENCGSRKAHCEQQRDLEIFRFSSWGSEGSSQNSHRGNRDMPSDILESNPDHSSLPSSVPVRQPWLDFQIISDNIFQITLSFYISFLFLYASCNMYLLSFIQKCIENWEVGLLPEVLAAQEWVPMFDLQNPHKKVCWHTVGISPLGRYR